MNQNADLNRYPERVWLFRHAQTTMPAVLHGAESDVDLSEHGCQQAKLVAEWCISLQPTLIVSSAMRRAVRSAEFIANVCHIPHVIQPAFHERRIGALCGQSYSDQRGDWVYTLGQWNAGQESYTTAGAESFLDLRNRLLPAWEATLQNYPGERVIVMAHGIVCKVLLLSLLPNLTIRDWDKIGHVLNLSYSELYYEQGCWTASKLLTLPPVLQMMTVTAQVKT
jgi:2,3-bisphosphoglycerate-dependent phosphoglycerate mutase